MKAGANLLNVSRRTLAACLLSFVPIASHALSFERVSIDLPAAPVEIIDSDIDGDGTEELVLVLAYTAWTERAVFEESRLDAVEGLVEVMRVVPALEDRREVHAYARTSEGYVRLGKPTELPLRVHAVEAVRTGPDSRRLLALVDGGVAALRFDGESFSFEPLVETETVLDRTDVFVPGLDFAHDLDGNGRSELVLPAPAGLAIHGATGSGYGSAPAAVVPLPGNGWVASESGLDHRYQLPRVIDVTGDGLVDIVLEDPRADGRRRWIAVNGSRRVAPNERPELRFGSPLEVLDLAPAEAEDSFVPIFLGDVDGRGRAELVTLQTLAPTERGFRAAMRAGESPDQVLRVHRLGEDLRPAVGAYEVIRARGHVLSSDSGPDLPGGFVDLDGDGRLDLVTMSLDLPTLGLVKALATKRLTVGIEFGVWCQSRDGSFRPATGDALSTKLRIDLRDIELRSLPTLAGDFDGDGRRDFVLVGGDQVRIHRGGDGCGFAKRPDARLDVAAAAARPGLVRIGDHDGDGRVDLAVVEPGTGGTEGPVRLSLFLSRSGDRR